MTRTTPKVLAGVAVAALAAAGVVAVVNYRQGRKLDPEERAYLDELAARLDEAEESVSDGPPSRFARILEVVQRNRGVSVGHLRSWIAGMAQGTLSPEQAILAESDFGALEREADQGGV